MPFHTFHMVEKSPWPLTSSLSSFSFMIGFINFMHYNNIYLFILGLTLIFLSMYLWWRDITREATFLGCHTYTVKAGLKLGMMLFILSEVLFFFSFFWSFFHASLSPDIWIGLTWPPYGLKSFNPYQIPLLNTTILLCSGITITWCHHSILNKNLSHSTLSIWITIFLGLYFSLLQYFEYINADFCLSDSIFGTTFFMATGFHGLHVIIGTTFIFLNALRLKLGHFSKNHHFGFEAAAWYWHFVDVVWLFLYSFVYWWSF